MAHDEFTRRRLLAASSSALALYGTAARASGVAVTKNLTDFGPAPGDGSDISTTIAAAHAFALANGGGCKIMWPAGTFRTSIAGLTLSASYYQHEGVRGETTLIPTFQGCPMAVGSLTDSHVEQAGIRGISFAAGAPQTSGSAWRFNQGVRCFIEDSEAFGFYDGLVFGSDDFGFQTTNIGRITRLRGGFQRHGIVMSSQASLSTEGPCQFSSNGVVDGAGILISGAMDGFFPDDGLAIDGFARGARITTAAANAANIRLRGSLANFRLAGLHIDLSGTGGLNGLSTSSDFQMFPALSPAGSADGIYIGNSGSGVIQQIQLDLICSDVPRRVVNAAARIQDARFRILSVRGGAEAAGTFPGMEFAGLAHQNVTLDACEFAGQHSYGVQGHHSIGGFNDIGTTAPGAVHGVFA